ncbi:very short patch repair endonuclease [Rhizobium hainanense]|uniref:very short patch repair endonuclease n=1 Tax=Rhizobium hainanense TaxID=52131 RepID=UPI00096A4470|nr:very short patch repair endonuclease [Rhizobium hainanense]
MDHVTQSQRSAIMSKVQSKNTLPEMKVRKALHKMGVRYRLHQKGLPGSPDIVMRSRSRVIFVHGCFWHRHGCRKSTVPKTNVEFWLSKFQRNVERDQENIAQLRALGWAVDIIWQCETIQPDRLHARLVDIMSGKPEPSE